MVHREGFGFVDESGIMMMMMMMIMAATIVVAVLVAAALLLVVVVAVLGVLRPVIPVRLGWVNRRQTSAHAAQLPVQHPSLPILTQCGEVMGTGRGGIGSPHLHCSRALAPTAGGGWAGAKEGEGGGRGGRGRVEQGELVPDRDPTQNSTGGGSAGAVAVSVPLLR